MKASLSLDDDLFDLYQAEATSRHLPVGDVLRERLARAVGLDPRSRSLVITDGNTLRGLEGLLGGGSLASAEDLLNKVRRLAGIRFGEHRFEITAGQYQELAHRATKRGLTIPQLVEEIYRKMQQDFWRYVP